MRRHYKHPKNVERAVALSYDQETTAAPKVIAKGEGLIASRIKEIALAKGVPIHRDDDLVQMLSALEIDREVPSELFAAVAEILAFIYKANQEKIKGN